MMKKINLFFVCLTLMLLGPFNALAYGGGGGGGFSYSAPSSTSNTATSTLSSTITSAATSERSYSRPMQLTSDVIKTVSDTKTAQLTTTGGSITLKPNRESDISVVIPPNTTVEANSDWGGKISPPILRSRTMINESGEEIAESNSKLLRNDVLAVVKAGSTESPLTFSNKVKMDVPVEGTTDGTPVMIYFSDDGIKWQYLTTSTVENGKVVFETEHFTYFAISKTAIGDEAFTVHFSAPKSTEDIKFIDTVDHWAENYIKQIVVKNIAQGKSTLRFAPNDYITRAELTKMAVNAFGLSVPESVSEKPFIDVDALAWYAPYIQVAKDHGVVQGYGQTFKPNNLINRVEASKVLLEAAGFSIGNQTSSSFSDTISGAWYMKYINFAKNKGIISGYGDGTFRPGNSITRAEVSKIIIKVLEQ